MPLNYQQNGIQFLYPDNWKIIDEQSVSNPPSVTLQSPGTGYWSLTIYPDSYHPEQLAQEAVDAIQEEYGTVEIDPVTCNYGDQLASGYHMAFYCLDLIVNAQAMALRVGSQTVLFVYQAEDSEFRKLDPVFKALAVSVLNHVNDPDQRAPSESL
ncbi:MAG: hypothetical protein GY917_32375 [Planctomycetaceae bacterium]|jgi:hypothetical protein|nr:hypothetical protein [Planctomycetaceae bacterium]